MFVYLKRHTTAMRILGVASSADLLFGLQLGLGFVIATAIQPYTSSGCLAQIWCGHIAYSVVFDMYAAYWYVHCSLCLVHYVVELMVVRWGVWWCDGGLQLSNSVHF